MQAWESKRKQAGLSGSVWPCEWRASGWRRSYSEQREKSSDIFKVSVRDNEMRSQSNLADFG